MDIDNEDKKLDAIAEQWVNLLFEQVRHQATIKNKNKKESSQQ
jgi:hypothetical protein